MAIILDSEGTRELLIKHLNAELTAAAEPVIQRALAEVEKVMRQRLAAFLIARLDQNLLVSRMEDRLVIQLMQARN